MSAAPSEPDVGMRLREENNKTAAATMTVEQIEDMRSVLLQSVSCNTAHVNELCALARDGLRLREAIARGPTTYVLVDAYGVLYGAENCRAPVSKIGVYAIDAEGKK